MIPVKQMFYAARKYFGDSNTIRLFAVLVVIFIVMGSLNPTMFFSRQNWKAIAFQIPELGFFTLAMMFVIISGGIDLSVVSVANLSGITAAFVLREALISEITGLYLGLLIFLVFCISLAIGTITGALNGILIAKFKVSPILVTLGTMNLFTGIGIIVTKGQSISSFPAPFLEIGNGVILGIPIYLLIFLIMVLISHLLLNKTKYGFDLKFYGSNPRASLFSGISNFYITLKTYTLSGIISAIVGLGFIARTNSARADYGASYIFASILCVILGGVNPNGGHGKLSDVLLSIFTLQILSSGFNMLRLPGSAKELAWGILLLTIMLINIVIEKRKLNKKTNYSIKEEAK